MKRRRYPVDQSRTEVKEYLISLIGHAPYGVLAIDMDGFVTIANSNAAACLEHEDSVQELVDQPILSLVNEMPLLVQHLRQCLAKGRKPFDLDQFPFRDRFLAAKGRVILNGMLLTLEDITQRVLDAERLQQQQRALEKSNRELAEFAYVSAHDMKSPIASLMGLMQVMDKKQAVKDEHAHVFNLLMRSAAHLQRTVLSLNEVIAFRKTLSLPRETVPIVDVLEEVRISIVEQLTSSGAAITTTLEAYPNIDLPRIHLHSIIQNLLTNAAKYRHSDRPLHIEVASGADESGLFLQVTDNGLGLDVERVKGKLFGLFQRFHPHVEGVGIGLHMVHAIVESYGGEIAVESTLGEGTTFRIYWGQHHAE